MVKKNRKNKRDAITWDVSPQKRRYTDLTANDPPPNIYSDPHTWLENFRSQYPEAGLSDPVDGYDVLGIEWITKVQLPYPLLMGQNRREEIIRAGGSLYIANNLVYAIRFSKTFQVVHSYPQNGRWHIESTLEPLPQPPKAQKKPFPLMMAVLGLLLVFIYPSATKELARMTCTEFLRVAQLGLSSAEAKVVAHERFDDSGTIYLKNSILKVNNWGTAVRIHVLDGPDSRLGLVRLNGVQLETAKQMYPADTKRTVYFFPCAPNATLNFSETIAYGSRPLALLTLGIVSVLFVIIGVLPVAAGLFAGFVHLKRWHMAGR